MKSKRLITSLLTLSMLASTIVPAYAAETNEVVDPLPNEGYSSVTLEVKDSSGGSGGETPDNPDIPPVDPTDIIIATVPVELPIVMDLEGNVTVPTDAKIINHSTEKGIKVTKISAALESDWAAADYSDDFTTKADNTKELGMSLRGDTLKADGTFPITDGNWNIAKDNNLPLNMGAKLPKQTETAKTKIATVGFTIDWSGLDGADGGSDPDAGKDNSGGSGEVNPPEEVTYTVSFTTDGNGILEGDTTATIKGGEPAPFPTAKPASIRYEHTGWVDATTNSPIEPTTPITSDTTIKAVFSERAASPKNWFTTDGANTITGLSAEYLDLVDAPTDLVIPNNIGGSTIKAIGVRAFANKDLITSIVIPDTITTLNNEIFKECSSLEAISIPSGVTSLPDNLFYNCTSLKSVEIPTTVKQIAANTFSGCTALEKLDLSYAYTNTIFNSPFGLSKDKIVWAPLESWDTNPMYSSEITALNLSFNSSTGEIKALNTNISGKLNIPSSVNGVRVTTIPEEGFYQRDKITGITIPESITTIGKNSFNGCTGITNINIPNSVTSIGSNAFANCRGLNGISIPESVTTIGGGAFGGCTSLTSINVDANNPNYVSENGVLFSKDKTTLVAYPVGKTETSYTIPNSVTSIGDYAFRNSANLTSITIPNSVTTIGNDAFFVCTSLNSVTIPNGVKTIGKSAFKNVPHITYHGTATGAPWDAKSMN